MLLVDISAIIKLLPGPLDVKSQHYCTPVYIVCMQFEMILPNFYRNLALLSRPPTTLCAKSVLQKEDSSNKEPFRTS